MHRSLLALLLFLPLALPAQAVVGPLAPGQYAVDETAGLLLCRADLATLNAQTTQLFTSVRAETNYELTTPVAALAYGTPYTVRRVGTEFTLYFTQLPLLNIATNEEIPDEPKVPAVFRYGDDDQTLEGSLGIELRGGFSQTFPKKTYDLEFWEDATGEDSRDVQFGSLRDDDDWVLDALYNEPLRLNAFVAHSLWLDLHEPYYLEADYRAKAGAGVMWCEVFVNERYQGIYLLSEQIDRKLLRIKKYDEGNNRIRGELYKSIQWSAPTKFEGPLSPFDNTEETLDEYELEYPDPDDIIDWSGLAELLSFTVTASDEAFAAGVTNWYTLENIADYFLFLNLTGAEDNSGKNIYTGRYDAGEPYFFVPWDLDGTFGNRWDGTDFPWVRTVLTNGLYRRLLENNVNGFNEALCARYGALTTDGLLAPDSLQERFRKEYDYLAANGVYAREAARWPGGFLDTTAAKLAYTVDWISARTEFLADWVCNIRTATDSLVPPTPLRIGPNPSEGRVFFNAPSAGKMPWRLFDLNGRLLQLGTVEPGQSELNLGRPAGGMYVLWLGAQAHKLVIR
ncbi:MAG: CotH kinase family protein [Bacteroidota bacterium]